ncbi:hypothetical protein FRC03_004703 [Tulasnella sp. 419]|nr:hypothetical protein FRC03_004703 [Tulasnella sp. 419]
MSFTQEKEFNSFVLALLFPLFYPPHSIHSSCKPRFSLFIHCQRGKSTQSHLFLSPTPKHPVIYPLASPSIGLATGNLSRYFPTQNLKSFLPPEGSSYLCPVPATQSLFQRPTPSTRSPNKRLGCVQRKIRSVIRSNGHLVEPYFISQPPKVPFHPPLSTRSAAA